MKCLNTVVVINDHAHINGGQAKVAIDSAKALASRGLNVVLFAACGPVDPDLEKSGVRVVCAHQDDILNDPNRVRAVVRGLWNFSVAQSLRQLLRSFNPASTIVHCHGYAKALSPSIGPVLTGGPWSHVYTCHEYFLACPNGGFYDYQRNEICKRRALSAGCLGTNCDVRRASHKAWRAMRQGVLHSFGGMPRNLRHVIFISETQRRVLEPYLGPNVKRYYVSNPVDVMHDERVRAEANRIFLFIGRLNPEKGGVLFARAAREAGVPAVFVGDGVEREAIKAEYPAALITGWLKPEEVSDWLSRTRSVVFPSLWYECAPLVVYEAMSRGVPVLTGRWNAAAEIKGGADTGAILDQPTVTAWRDALRKQLSDEIVAKQSIKSYALPIPNMTEHVENLMQVYMSCLNSKVGQSSCS